MIKNNKHDLTPKTTKISDDNDFMRKFVNDDNFTMWLLLDFTEFAIGRLRDLELATIGITREQAMILQTLNASNGKSTIGNISDSIMRRTHSISTMVRRMEKQGLVRIIKHAKQKELEVAITVKGRQLREKITTKTIDAIFPVLSQEERMSLSLSLKLLLVKARNLER